MNYDFTLTSWAVDGSIKWEKVGAGEWLIPDNMYRGVDLRGRGFFAIWYLYEGTRPEEYEHIVHVPCFAVGHGSPNDLYKVMDSADLRRCRIAIKWAMTPRIIDEDGGLRDGMLKFLARRLRPLKGPDIAEVERIPIPVPEPPSVGPTT